MKKILLILMSTLMLVNCKDDDDSKSESAQNKITYNGEEFPIIDFELLDDGADIILTGIVNQEDNGFIIRFLSHDIENVEGNYTIKREDEIFNSNLHCHVVMNLPNTDMLISAGNVSVNVDDNTIMLEFEFEGLGVSGSVKGYYKGSL
ncbi:hypothetical protein [Moheibacter sediminis]|uniref:Uncharacterized protein n=1 Tax=Moheibacter sediminis TaxID=1434700 RepID=A0A1W2AVC9_9FLAO|nr:hypothetical protein [Moheibacter sediminis]SMC64643.1 hypothetical protein SAMN06296427_105103 [Moheibacter sediminis]